MAHEIDFSTGKAAIAYSGETPWHKLGTKVDNMMTSAEALEFASLDWHVSKHPAFHTGPDGIPKPIPNRFVTVRDDVHNPLGVVGSWYKPIQNKDAFDFMDSVVSDGGMRYEVAGALAGGATVWMLAKLPSQTRICHDDISNHYLLFQNTHDGRAVCSVSFTTVRVVCANTLRIAGLRGLEREVKIRHTGSIHSKLEHAQMVLGLAEQSFADFGKQALALSFKDTSQAKIDAFLKELFAVETAEDLKRGSIKKQAMDSIKRLVESGLGSDLVGSRGTYWGLFNAVTEFVDHYKDIRKTGREPNDLYLDSITYGAGYELKRKAWELAVTA